MKHLAIALLLILPWTVSSSGQPTVPQPIAATGRVMPVVGPTICMANVTHYLECTQVYLKSSGAVDLKKVEGKIVRVVGKHAALTCDVIDVKAIENPPATLDWCGMPSPGCPLRFVICPGGISMFWLFAATGPGFYPIDPVTGSFLIDLHTTVLLTAGPSTGGPCTRIDVKVPNIGSIVGLDVHLQGARMDVGPVGPIRLTNAVCFRITPFMPPCGPINC